MNSPTTTVTGKTPPWREYSVGQIGATDWSCSPFVAVTHIAHIRHAVAIIADKRLKADLVRDKSKLNTHRIRVVLMSPNKWRYGTRYGNVSFKLDMPSLCQKKHAYWVEVMKEYNPYAPRILLTEKEHNHPDLVPYDPTQGDGPWWFDKTSQKHYFNGDYTLEFMVEDDIELGKVIEIDFETHSKDMCSLNKRRPSLCSDYKVVDYEAKARFLSGVLANNLRIEDTLLGGPSLAGTLPELLQTCYAVLMPILCIRNKPKFAGTITSADAVAVALARALCGAYYNRLDVEVDTIRTIFRSEKDCIAAIHRLICEQHGIKPE